MDVGGIRKGEPWGKAVSEGADEIVIGGDADLACRIDLTKSKIIAWTPDSSSDLATTLGLTKAGAPKPAHASRGHALPVDALSVRIDGANPMWAVSSVAVGQTPNQTRRWHRRRAFALRVDNRQKSVSATGVIAMNAQHLEGLRVVPSGHPGDGKAEVQWFGLAPVDRAKMRKRLALAEHLGHKDVGSATFRQLTVEFARRRSVCIDGVPFSAAYRVEISVVAAAFQILI